MSLANGNPAEAARIIARLDLDDLDNLTANDAAAVHADALDADRRHRRRRRRPAGPRGPQPTESAWVALARAATSLAVMLYEAGDINAAVDLGERCLADIDQAGLAGTDEHIRLGATYMFALFARGDVISATEVVQRLIKVADRVGTSRARGSIYWNAAIVAQETRRARRGPPAHRPRCCAAQRGGGEQRPPAAAPPLRLAAAAPRLPRRRRRARPARPGRHPLLRPRVKAGPGHHRHAARSRTTWCWASSTTPPSRRPTPCSSSARPSTSTRAEALILLGDVGSARFEEDLADEAFREARTVLAGMTTTREVARLWRQLGDSLRRIGDQPGALHAYDASLTIAGMPQTPHTSRVRVAAA